PRLVAAASSSGSPPRCRSRTAPVSTCLRLPDPILRSAGITNVRFGAIVTVVQPSNLYECVIGDGSFVGPFVEIQRHVTIGSHCRIQSHSFICEKVTIGNHCFISHGVMFVNDRFRTGQVSREPESWGATVLGESVLVGTNGTI